MNIKRIKCGSDNCYLVINNNEALLIDTCRAKDRKKILEACKGYKIKMIVLTHGHLDHIGNAAYLSKEFNIPIAMNKEDIPLIKENRLELMTTHSKLGKVALKISQKAFDNYEMDLFEPSILLNHGDSLMDYGFNCKVIGLPGHTKGSIGIEVDENNLIVGDALMNLISPGLPLIYGHRKNMEKSCNDISNYNVCNIHFGHGKSANNRKWLK